MDTQLEAHIRQHIEAITVDSASDELLACELMRGCGGLTPQTLPNLKCIIRDATHAARRVIAKPEKADPFLQEVHMKLVSAKSSISQILHNSTTLWQPKFAERVKELDDRISDIKNIRAAKHRHESFAKPAECLILYLDAYLATAEEMVASGSPVKEQAKDFLEYLSAEVLCQAAMLADAADECLLFVRLLDSEDTDSAKLNDAVGELMDRMRCLFTESQCVSLPGYTSYMLANLHRTKAVRVGNRIITLGCPHGVPVGILNNCLGRMRAFTEVAKAVLEAEFPSYDLSRAFCIFNLAKSGGGLTPLDTMSDDVSRNFARLSTAFDVDMDHLVAQYNDHLPLARRVKVITGSSNQEAWQEAVRKTQRHSSSSHPATALITVLQRYLCYTISTAKVEQSFSKLKRVLGEHCLGGSEVFEARLVKVILDRTGTHADTTRIERAREIWGQHWELTCRTPYAQRLDKGVLRPHQHSGEKQWVRERRDGVGRAVAIRGLTRMADHGPDDSLAAESALAPSHCAVIEQQHKKCAKRKALALLEGTLLADEQLDAAEDATNEKANMVKRAKGRLAATSKQQKRCSTRISSEVLRGLSVYVEDTSTNVGGLTPTLFKLGCHVVRRRCLANIFVVSDLADLGMRTRWCAALVGGYVTTAGALESGGPLLQHFEASSVRRTLWLSQQFRDRHPKVVEILNELAFSPEALGSVWTLQESEDGRPTTKGAVALVRKGVTLSNADNKSYDVEICLGMIAKVNSL